MLHALVAKTKATLSLQLHLSPSVEKVIYIAMEKCGRELSLSLSLCISSRGLTQERERERKESKKSEPLCCKRIPMTLKDRFIINLMSNDQSKVYS